MYYQLCYNYKRKSRLEDTFFQETGIGNTLAAPALPLHTLQGLNSGQCASCGLLVLYVALKSTTACDLTSLLEPRSVTSDWWRLSKSKQDNHTIIQQLELSISTNTVMKNSRPRGDPEDGDYEVLTAQHANFFSLSEHVHQV